MINKSAQKLFNNTLLYSLGMVASKAVGFFLVPIYTYNMPESQYGVATTITSFVTTFGIVMMLGLRAALIRFYGEYDEEKRRRFVGSVVSLTMVSALAWLVLLCAANRLYMPYIFEGITFFPCVFLGVMSLAVEGIYLTYQSLLQAKQDGKHYSLNSMLYLFFHGVTVVIFVAVLKLEAMGIVLSNFVTNLCFAVYGMWDMRRKGLVQLAWEPQLLKDALKYSLPILPHDLCNHLSIYSVKLIINRFISYAISGLYTLASQFATIMSFVQTSINLAFRPWIVEQMREGEEGRKQIRHMTHLIMSLLSFVAVGVSLFSKEFVFVMADKDYLAAWKMVPLFIVAQLFAFVYYSYVQVLLYNVSMSKFSAICSFSGLVTNVGVSLLLVNWLDIYGIMVAQVVSQAVLSLVTVVLSRRAEKVGLGLGVMLLKIAAAAVLIAGGYAVSVFFQAPLSLLGIALKLLLCGVAFLVFILPHFSDYKQLLGGLFARRRKPDTAN